MPVRSTTNALRSRAVAEVTRAWAWPAAGLLLATAFATLVMPARAPRYDIDVPPPDGSETYAEVLPMVIAGERRRLQVMVSGSADVHGARAEYGGRAVIDVVHAPSPGALDAFVRQSLESRLVAYHRRRIGRASGAWELHGQGDKGRFYGWQNRDWLFVIEASDDEAFEEAVDGFAYIRRE